MDQKITLKLSNNTIIHNQALKNKNFDEANIQLVNMQMVLTPSTYEQIIYQILKSFNQLFLNKQISEIENYGKLSKILSAFQYCYLGNDKANNYFTNLINLDSGDYSRYLFFYLSNLIDKNEYELVKNISKNRANFKHIIIN